MPLGNFETSHSMAQERLLLNANEVADTLGISIWTVRRLITRGTLPCVRIGRRTLIESSDIQQFINDNKKGNGIRRNSL